MNYLVAGAGGFIGGHLVSRLLSQGHQVRCVDVKPLNLWFQLHDDAENISLDLQNYENCLTATAENIDGVFNMACNMGGIGFIEWNRAKCMLSVLINTHLLMACQKNKIKNYFFSSSACAYNKDLQQESFINGLKESDAYPANPEDGYGWEKLFSERMCRHFMEDFKLNVKVARYHNIFGPLGTYDGGREKSPAALCRKIAQNKIDHKNEIEVWGDGKQTRSFLYIEDCLDATLKLFNSDFAGPVNIGSEEQVSINEMISIIENIANYKVNKKYNLDMPVGVKGRSSNNELVKEKLDWSPKFTLKMGLEVTYNWIYESIKSKSNTKSIFTISY
jgi:nucleoside-diphosphate-sugar epimerase